MYLYNKVSCVYCQQEFSIKGIHSHYRISHTEEGKRKHLLNSRKGHLKGGEATRQKFKNLYHQNPSFCKNCETKLAPFNQQNKFCSRSCAATFNNKIIKIKKRPLCKHCGKETKTQRSIFCSSKCSGLSRKLTLSDKERKAKNAAAQAKYRAKYGYLRAYDPGADKDKIKEIYANCPDGYEVDHIIPLSKGGKHHENNLQYLTISENRRKGNKII